MKFDPPDHIEVEIMIKKKKMIKDNGIIQFLSLTHATYLSWLLIYGNPHTLNNLVYATAYTEKKLLTTSHWLLISVYLIQNLYQTLIQLYSTHVERALFFFCDDSGSFYWMLEIDETLSVSLQVWLFLSSFIRNAFAQLKGLMSPF